MVNMVIDASWLRGTSFKDLQSLVSDKKVLIPAALGYELLTTKDESKQIENFRKLNSIKESISLIDHVGSFLRYEIETQTPCTPIDKMLLPDFEFEEVLFNSRRKMSKQQQDHLESFQRDWEISGTEIFQFISAGISYWFSELKEGCSDKDIESALTKAKNEQIIKKIYREVREHIQDKKFPPSEVIDEKWACYRWVQIVLLAGINYTKRYGAGNMKEKSRNFAHDNIDIQYAITGILAEAIATRDTKIKWYFQQCCPNGILYD